MRLTEGYYYLDSSAYLTYLTRSAAFVTHTGRSLVLPSVGSLDNVGGKLCFGVKLIIDFIINLIATVLYAIGCPIDRIRAGMISSWASTKAQILKIFCCLRVCMRPDESSDEENTLGTRGTEIHLNNVNNSSSAFSPMIVQPERVIASSKDSAANYKALPLTDEAPASIKL